MDTAIQIAENWMLSLEDVEYVPDNLFPTDNDMKVPMLRLDRQPQTIQIPFVLFGEQKRSFKMNGHGTLHFYTDDYKFQSVYEHPEKIFNHHPANIVEPNFSLFNEVPVAFGLQQVYKKRQIARQMQEMGIGVFVDLNVAAKYYKLNLLGVPTGYSSFCTRGYSDRMQYLEYEWMLARQIVGGNPLKFVIYGGGQKCREFAREHGAVYVSPIIDIKNTLRRMEAKMKITENVMFVGDGQNVKQLIADTKKRLYDNQVLNFTEQHKLEVTNPPKDCEVGDVELESECETLIQNL